jgi:hypothetical protein
MEHTYNRFCDFFAEAVHFAVLSRHVEVEPKVDLESMYAKTAMLTAVFALEAAANCLIDTMDLSNPSRNDFDKLTILGKYHLYLLGHGKGSQFDRGSTAVQHVKDLIEFRNDQVHSRPDFQAVPANADGTFTYPDIKRTAHLKLPLRSFFVEPDHAAAAIVAVDAFLETYLLRWCGMSLDEAATFLFHRMDTGVGPPHFMTTRLYKGIQDKFDELGISAKYMDRHLFTAWTGRRERK